MFAYIWPVGLIVASNIIYHICAKCLPGEINPFASLFVSYLVSALTCLVLYFVLGSGDGIAKEISRMNWAPWLLGVVIVGLEAGVVYAYKAGWPVNSLAIVQSAILGAALIVVGYFLFSEVLTWNKLVGIVVCMIGLVFINLK